MENHNSFIYLKPNRLMNESFENIELQIYGSMIAAILVLALIIFVLRRLLKPKKVKKIKAPK